MLWQFLAALSIISSNDSRIRDYRVTIPLSSFNKHSYPFSVSYLRMLGVSITSSLLGSRRSTSSSRRILISLDLFLTPSGHRQQSSVLFVRGYLNKPFGQQPIYNQYILTAKTQASQFLGVSLMASLIIKMQLTILKRNQSQKKIESSHDPDPNTSPFTPGTRAKHDPFGETASKAPARQTQEEQSYCNNWIFSRCFRKSRESSNLYSPRQSNALKADAQSPEYVRTPLERSSKIKVMSCVGKTLNRNQMPNSQSLKKIKTLQSVLKKSNGFELILNQKDKELQETKNCTIAYPSASISRQTSIRKRDQGTLKIRSFANQMSQMQSDKKMHLTISKLLPFHNNTDYGNISQFPSLQLQTRPGDSSQLFRQVKQDIGNGTHLRMSSNELKIIDPYEEKKSLDTEYLINRIAFSQGRTQKDVRTQREAIIDYLYEPIKILDQDYEATPRLQKKRDSQIYRSLAIRNIYTPDQHELTQVSKNSESIVIEKGIADIFHLAPSNSHKISSETKPIESANGSMIKYDTSENDDQEQWFKLSLIAQP